jgi:hypothetical protein
MDNLKSVMQNRVSRRRFITGVSAGMGAAAAVSLAAGCGGGNSSTTAPTTAPTTAAPSGVTDVDILNFALNLEYLEAEFYLLGTTGSGLQTADIGTSPGTVTGGAMVPFQTPAIQQYANEIALQEQQHVQDIRSLITTLGGTPVDRPTLDFTNAFNAAASAAGIGSTFNPFDNEDDFILGSFVFEDVGVTAYHGAGTLIQNKTQVLPAAGGIQAVEAYHAATIRTLLVGLGGAYVTNANLISNLRGAASAVVVGGTGAAETTVSASTIVAADSNSIAYDRNTDQVLHIVYLSATAGVVKSGGFYPNGMNGTITATAS